MAHLRTYRFVAEVTFKKKVQLKCEEMYSSKLTGACKFYSTVLCKMYAIVFCTPIVASLLIFLLLMGMRKGPVQGNRVPRFSCVFMFFQFFNPFLANGLIENQKFSGVFKGYKLGT